MKEAAGRPNCYVNAYGVHEYGASWTLPLKAIARMGWLLHDMPPLDYSVFCQLASSMLELGQWSPTALVCLFVGHCLKRPPAVAAFHASLLQQEKPLTADSIVSAWLDAIRAVAGKSLKHVHKSMSSTGRMHAMAGIVVHSQWAGLIAKATGGKEERRRIGWRWACPRRIFLGPATRRTLLHW